MSSGSDDSGEKHDIQAQGKMSSGSDDSEKNMMSKLKVRYLGAQMTRGKMDK